MRNTVAKEAILKIINSSENALSQTEVQDLLPNGLWTCNKKLDFKLSDYAASF